MRSVKAIILPALAASLALGSAAGPSEAATSTRTFVAEVWADNWFALYVNGKKVGQDSVPITTERSFNSERITFTATLPLTVALVGKDFKENDSGLEYIGTDRQQMGDGGIIAQITDVTTGEVIAATDSTWAALVVHEAPLNPECVTASDPLAACDWRVTANPRRWTKATFIDTTWPRASVFTQGQVGVKEGYFDFDWAPGARLIWGPDLQEDNTVLFRKRVQR